MSRQSAFKFQNGNRHERACLSDVHKILIIIFIFYKRKKRIRKKNNSFYVYTYILYISIPSKYSAIPVSYTHLDVYKRQFLNELLHLVHGIFRDDELINGKDSIPEAYLSKPICNLLLSIANAKSDVFSESIVRKADYLLEKMIMKKPNELFESLIASFGNQYVNDYKDKKLRQGVNLQETEKERKRRLAKKHQARLLAKFNNQQTKFMKEHESEFDEQDNDCLLYTSRCV